MTRPWLLVFDTSGPYCEAGLLHGDSLVAHAREEMGKGQAERLMPLIQAMMDKAETPLAALDAIVVGTGPGNFTGIRLGVAAARGLALSLGRPAIGVSLLEALAQGGPRPMLAQLDARRGAVYAQRFDHGGTAPPALITDPEQLPDDLPRLGDGPGAVAPEAPLALRLGLAALPRLDQETPRPQPLYIRPADAAPPREAPPPLLP